RAGLAAKPLERRARDEGDGAAAVKPVDRVRVGPEQRQRLADVTRERLLPGPEDGTGRVLLPVQNRVDRVAELDDAVDALAVREDERQAARLLVPLGADSYQRPVALVVDEPPFGVDEPEAAVAPDASALEHDLVGVHEPERLDG